MRIPLFLLLFAIMAGCASHDTYLEVGAGVNKSLNNYTKWNAGGGLGAYIGLRHEMGINEDWRAVCYAKHYSQYDVGHPFNNRAESSLDTFGCAIGRRIFKGE